MVAKAACVRVVGDQPGVVARPLIGNVPSQGQTQKLKTQNPPQPEI